MSLLPYALAVEKKIYFLVSLTILSNQVNELQKEAALSANRTRDNKRRNKKKKGW